MCEHIPLREERSKWSFSMYHEDNFSSSGSSHLENYSRSGGVSMVLRCWTLSKPLIKIRAWVDIFKSSLSECSN